MKTVLSQKQSDRFLLLMLVTDSFICIFDVQATAAENILAAAVGLAVLYVAACVVEHIPPQNTKWQTLLLCVAFLVETALYLVFVAAFCTQSVGFSLPVAALYVLPLGAAAYAWKCGVQAVAKVGDVLLVLLLLGTVLLLCSLWPQLHTAKLQYAAPRAPVVLPAAVRYLYSLPEVLFHRVVQAPQAKRKQSSWPFIGAFLFAGGYFLLNELAMGSAAAGAQRPHFMLARLGVLAVLHKQDTLQQMLWLLAGLAKLCCLFMLCHGALCMCCTQRKNARKTPETGTLLFCGVGTIAVALCIANGHLAFWQAIAAGLPVVWVLLAFGNKGKKTILVLLFALLLSACGADAPLAQRAIISGVSIQKDGETYRASLAVQAPEKTANTAEVTVKLNCFTGNGATVRAALQNAQEQTEKQPFYEQNEILLLHSTLTEKEIRTVWAYETAEDTMKNNTAVFLTDVNIETMEKEELYAFFEALQALAQQRNAVEDVCTRLFDADVATGDAFALPVVAWQDGHLRFCGWRLFGAGGQQAFLQGKDAQLFLALQGKRKSYALCVRHGGKTVTVALEDIRLLKTATENCAFGNIEILLAARVRQQYSGTVPQEAVTLSKIQQALQKETEALLQKTFLQGIDSFSFADALALQDAKAAQQLQATGALYKNSRLHLQVHVRA